MATDGLLQTLAFIALGGYAVYFLVFAIFQDVFLARSMERAAEINFSLIRNRDIGRSVRVITAFSESSGKSYGKVSLSGEVWDACSNDGVLFEVNEELVVVGRDGLVLEVTPSNKSLEQPGHE